MITLPAAVKVFLCLTPVDMRLSYDGLASKAASIHQQNPLSGHLFVFLSRRRDRVKILYWDRDGLAIWQKRLEKGTFSLPGTSDDSNKSLELSSGQLALLLDGIDFASVKRRARFSL